jgi:hypothetical protein
VTGQPALAFEISGQGDGGLKNYKKTSVTDLSKDQQLRACHQLESFSYQLGLAGHNFFLDNI